MKCEHCKTSGTCTASAGSSCEICVERWKGRGYKIENPTDTKLMCSVCRGEGRFEERGRESFDYRLQGLLSITLVVVCFALLWFTLVRGHDEEFSKSLVFVGTLLGSITGYYFGGQKAVAMRNHSLQKNEWNEKSGEE